MGARDYLSHLELPLAMSYPRPDNLAGRVGRAQGSGHVTGSPSFDSPFWENRLCPIDFTEGLGAKTKFHEEGPCGL